MEFQVFISLLFCVTLGLCESNNSVACDNDHFELNLNRSGIKHVKKFFVSSSRVTHLNLQYNNIENIENGAFNEMPNLRLLNLTGNNLTQSIFETIYNPSVETLVLDEAFFTPEIKLYGSKYYYNKMDFVTIYRNINISLPINHQQQLTLKKCFKFPYIKDLSGPLNRCLASTNTKLVFYNLERVGDLYSNLKDTIPSTDRSGVIYKIPCECKKCYVGQTKQKLGTRLKQHINDCKPEKFIKNEKTALAVHHFDTGHIFNFEETKILDYEMNWTKRNVSEMVYIRLNDTINHRTDTQGLSRVYNNILDKFKRSR